jgi:ribonuclease J
MAAGTHNDVDIREGDTVIISATPIPGNETSVSNLINDLVEQGAHVVTHKTHNVHVHGHAAREELRAVHNLLQPRHFVPVHGEYRMLKAHVDLAIEHGVHKDDAFLLQDGDMLRLTDDTAEVVAQIPAGHVFIHGHGVWDEHGNVIVERRLLARDGFVVVVLGRNSKGQVVGRPRIVSSGFVHYAEADALFEDAIDELSSVLDRDSATPIQWNEVEATVKKTVGRLFSQRTRRRPNIIPVAFDV